MRICYIGNLKPPHSTENHVTIALRANGARVVQFQENAPTTWQPGRVLQEEPDLIMWTKTWSLPEFEQRARLDEWKTAGVPTVAFHLDRWWGLAREHQVRDEPMFACDLVVTADGGHDDLFAAAGVNHLWMPPAISAVETQRVGDARSRNFREPLVFVGSTGKYHDEWSYRLELIAFLKHTYGSKLALWPRDARSVRGQYLSDLYASARVVVGDSCLVANADGSPCVNYWSDRIPETLGRGGFLIHPWVGGLDAHFTAGEHYVEYPLGHFDMLKEVIDYWLDESQRETRDAIRVAGQQRVIETATYEIRMQQLFDVLHERNMVPA